MLIFGLVGGLLPDLLRIIKLKYDEVPAYLKKPWFYIGTLLQMALGVFIVYLLQVDEAVYALACGYSAPQILTNLMDSAAEKLTQQQQDTPDPQPKPDPLPNQGMMQFWKK